MTQVIQVDLFLVKVYLVSEEEKVLPDTEVIINLTHEIVEDILKLVLHIDGYNL